MCNMCLAMRWVWSNLWHFLALKRSGTEAVSHECFALLGLSCSSYCDSDLLLFFCKLIIRVILTTVYQNCKSILLWWEYFSVFVTNMRLRCCPLVLNNFECSFLFPSLFFPINLFIATHRFYFFFLTILSLIPLWGSEWMAVWCWASCLPGLPYQTWVSMYSSCRKYGMELEGNFELNGWRKDTPQTHVMENMLCFHQCYG